MILSLAVVSFVSIVDILDATVVDKSSNFRARFLLLSSTDSNNTRMRSIFLCTDCKEWESSRRLGLLSAGPGNVSSGSIRFEARVETPFPWTGGGGGSWVPMVLSPVSGIDSRACADLSGTLPCIMLSSSSDNSPLD